MLRSVLCRGGAAVRQAALAEGSTGALLLLSAAAAATRPVARRVLRADAGVAGLARLRLPPHGPHRRRRSPLHQAPHDACAKTYIRIPADVKDWTIDVITDAFTRAEESAKQK